MSSHSIVADEIRAEIDGGHVVAVDTTRSARQGDVIAVRVGPAADNTSGHMPTPAGGVVIAAGAHGEHRLHAVLVVIRESGAGVDRRVTADLPAGGLVVHTDQPAARHTAIRLAPGRWSIQQTVELGLDECMEASHD